MQTPNTKDKSGTPFKKKKNKKGTNILAIFKQTKATKDQKTGQH